MRGRLKELEEERSRVMRQTNTQQQNIDKYRKIADDAKSKTDSLEGQLAAARKVT